MKALLTTCFLTGVLLSGGCATRKYVRNTVAPVQSKVDQVGGQTTQNAQEIKNAEDQMKQVDDRAQSGISGANEKASTADQRAADAMNHAEQAYQSAGQANQKAEQASMKTDQNNQALASLRDTVANIDDYKLQTSATIAFNFNQYRLSQAAMEDLDKLAVEVQSDKRFLIAVEGYTDKTGSKEYNEALSRRRADAVVEYLVARHEIPIYRIHMVGLGENKPADEGSGRAANARNRRVEVKVFTADQTTALRQSATVAQ